MRAGKNVCKEDERREGQSQNGYLYSIDRKVLLSHVSRPVKVLPFNFVALSIIVEHSKEN
jgi:hypothetical protein